MNDPNQERQMDERPIRGRRRRHDERPDRARDRGRGRMRRGDIRTAVLAALAERPGHGYEVIQTLEEKTGGAWRPSPGSVYPMLQLLEDEGLVRATERDGKRVYEITDAGRAESETRITDAGGAPWEHIGTGQRRHGELREAIHQLRDSTRHIAAVGNQEQVERAVAILRDARKAMYALLGD